MKQKENTFMEVQGRKDDAHKIINNIPPYKMDSIQTSIFALYPTPSILHSEPVNFQSKVEVGV